MGADTPISSENAASPADASTTANECESCNLSTLDSDRSDASGNNWQTEAVHEAIKSPLKAIGKLLAHPESLDREHLTAIADPEYVGTTLKPANLTVAFEDPTFVVLRPGKSPAVAVALEQRGLTGLQQSLDELVESLVGTKDVRSKFKVFRIAKDSKTGAYDTTVYVQLFGSKPGGGVEINATWQCRWAVPTVVEQGGEPRLLGIRVIDYEQVNTRSGNAGPLLSDCTEAVLGGNRSFDQQIRLCTNHWMDRLDYRAGVDMQGHQGLAVGDIDGDGLDDVYLCQNGALPNLLFKQNADGTATESAAAAGLDLLTSARGALLLDLDNDGDQDLVLTSDQSVMILENDGQAHFQMRAGWKSPSHLYSISAADFDKDGDLDIYVCGLVEHNERPMPVPYHDANNGGRNALLANLGSWQFREVTDQVGLDHNNSRFSYASSWEDYDNDGDQDLYVANDFGRNNLYRNDNGHFVDVAAEAGVEDIGAGMSATWGDYNADGHMDLYVSNMFSSAGGRIAYQTDFGGAYSSDEKLSLQRHARGNTLLTNQGDGTFKDDSEAANVTVGRWAWGSSFVDLNNDGLQDLLVANGYITGDDTKDL